MVDLGRCQKVGCTDFTHTQKKTGLENQYGIWLKYCKAKVPVVLVLEVVLLLFSMSCFDKNSNTLTYMFV